MSSGIINRNCFQHFGPIISYNNWARIFSKVREKQQYDDCSPSRVRAPANRTQWFNSQINSRKEIMFNSQSIEIIATLSIYVLVLPSHLLMQKFCLDFFFIFLAHRANLSMSCSSPWGTSSGIGRETEKRRRRNKSSKLQIRTCRCGLTQINLPREETKAHSASFSPTQIGVQDLCIGHPKKKISHTATSKWAFFSLSPSAAWSRSWLPRSSSSSSGTSRSTTASRRASSSLSAGAVKFQRRTHAGTEESEKQWLRSEREGKPYLGQVELTFCRWIEEREREAKIASRSPRKSHANGINFGKFGRRALVTCG